MLLPLFLVLRMAVPAGGWAPFLQFMALDTDPVSGLVAPAVYLSKRAVVTVKALVVEVSLVFPVLEG